jgi:aminoglycoside phosphotransferase (APT) family kinase protein
VDDLPLIGRGRAADVFDVGDGRVLRRYRTAGGGFAEREAEAMRHLRERGAPVPEVFSADGLDMVMERLDGPTMLDTLKSRPWRAAALGRELASLQARIHAVPAGGLDLPRFSEGDAVLHLDLHPDNVMLTDQGPMVIDFSNVMVGDPVADVVNTWMLMATSSADDVPVVLRPVLRRIRAALVRGFLEHLVVDDDARRWVTLVCDRRLQDPNTRDDERVRVREFAEAHGPVQA